MGVLRALGFHQKYLQLCSEDKQRSYGFKTTWGWVIDDSWWTVDDTQWTGNLYVRVLQGQTAMLTWGVRGCGSGWWARVGVLRVCRAPRWRAGRRASGSVRRASCPCSAGCRRPPRRSQRAPEGAGSSEMALVSGWGLCQLRCSDCCLRQSEAASVMISACRLRSHTDDLCRKAFPWKALETGKAGVNKRSHRTRGSRTWQTVRCN